MGGHGIGKPRRKKMTIEHCRRIRADPLARAGFLAADLHRLGSMSWPDHDPARDHSPIDIEVRTSDEGTGTLRLSYTLSGTRERVDYEIDLQTTRPRLGGLRWWFTCPLSIADRPCRRRCGILYAPPKARYFGCRTCHDLTYQSCQESGCYDPALRRLSARTGIPPRELKRIMKGQAGEGRRRGCG